MFCQYQYYRRNTEKLQTAVAHSDKNYKCKKMSDCPHTGTTVINNIPWGDYPAGESDQSEESDTNREEDREEEIIIEEPEAQEMEENVEMARSDSEEDRSDRSQCYDVRNCCNIL